MPGAPTLTNVTVPCAQLMGRIAPSTGIAPFTALVEQVMTTEPYASARVFWIVDNGSSHAGKASITRMGEAWPTATLVHLPVHASWLNQIEIVFSVIQRKVIKPADFDDLDALAQRLIEFEPRYNATAAPFDWRFTPQTSTIWCGASRCTGPARSSRQRHKPARYGGQRARPAAEKMS